MAQLQKVKASMMNAIHDLPLLVARDEGFFRDEGLDVDVMVTPGSGQHNSDDRALKDDIFKRGLESQYDNGQCDQFRMRVASTAVTIQERTYAPPNCRSAQRCRFRRIDPKSGFTSLSS